MMPTYEQVDKVASAFETLANEYNSPVVMSSGDVIGDIARHRQRNDIPSVCGTIACHGGWYAFYINRQNIQWRLDMEHNRSVYVATVPTVASTGETYNLPVTFRNGSEQMAKDLGFSGDDAVRNMLCFFRDNPEIWGSPYGNEMFASRRAFLETDDRTRHPLDLKHLARHWRGVADRIKVAENAA